MARAARPDVPADDADLSAAYLGRRHRLRNSLPERNRKGNAARASLRQSGEYPGWKERRMASDAGVRAFRFRIGDITCAIVSDGTFAYAEPGHLLFANAPQAARDSVLGANGIDADAWHEYVSPYSALLIDTGQRHILVDTGAGNLAATTGQLRDHLRAEDVDLAGIDMVVLTHAHADHIGGNLDAEGRPAFPSARWV